MNIVLQSVATGALVVLAVCAIVFPTILIAQFHGFKKDFKKNPEILEERKPKTFKNIFQILRRKR